MNLGEKGKGEEGGGGRQRKGEKMGGCVLTEGERRPRDVDFTSYG